MEWMERLESALALIENKLTDKVAVEEIARHAYSSSFHFQRMFHLHTGVTIAEYIRKRRFTLAAQELTMTSARIIDIALKYGYESPESFTKAFRKMHGISPSEARAQGAMLKASPRIALEIPFNQERDMEYRIVKQPGFQVVGRTIQLDMQISEEKRIIPAFWQQCERDGTLDSLRTLNGNQELLGICSSNYEDEVQRYMVAAKYDGPTLSMAYESFHIPASTWSVFQSTGPMPTALHNVWNNIVEDWFPATGYQHTGGPELEVYGEGDYRTEDYKCEIWIPIQMKSHWISG